MSLLLLLLFFFFSSRLVGLVVKASGLSHTSDLKNGTPVTTLSSAWCYRVRAGTGWPGVSML